MEKNEIIETPEKIEDIPPPDAAAPLANFPNLNPEKKPINYKSYFNFIQGDITTMKADVIVNSSTASMAPITGVSKSIHKKCGPSLLIYLKQNYYGILPGSFVDSPGFNLSCKAILHVCGPDKNEEGILSTIYDQCLNYCFNRNYHSIIFPCISTGGRKFNEEELPWVLVDCGLKNIKIIGKEI